MGTSRAQTHLWISHQKQPEIPFNSIHYFVHNLFRLIPTTHKAPQYFVLTIY